MENIIIDKVRLENYATMIKNINKATSQCPYTNHKVDDLIEDMINKEVKRKSNFGGFDFEHVFFNMSISSSRLDTPLAFIYYHKCNIYAQLIMCITQYSFTMSERWENACESIRGPIGTARKFVKLFKESENVTERYQFIFWALMILTVDKRDAEEHLSLICDYAKMLDITDDEFEDIIRTIQIIYNQEKLCSFKTKTIPAYFNKLFELMKIQVD